MTDQPGHPGVENDTEEALDFEPRTDRRFGLKQLRIVLLLPMAGLALAGIGLLFFVPSQIFRPEAERAWGKVRADYQAMIDDALAELPARSTAYADREACWSEGRTLCIYGWYMERRKDGALVSFTLAADEDADRGILRGWWWEVSPTGEVRPLWRSERLREKYGLLPAGDLPQGTRRSEASRLPPPIPPLMKVP